MPSQCIDRIRNWVTQMGIKEPYIHINRNRELVVTRILFNGDSFKVYISQERDNTVVFQSLAFKNATGNSEAESYFYQSILQYNGLMDLVSFSLVQMNGGKEWGVVASSIQDCRQLTPEFTLKIFQAFDRAYVEFVPYIKGQASQLCLSLNGKLRQLPG